MSSGNEVFVILTGVSGNLGDAVIRRRVLEWSRGLGQIHAYVGATTQGWVEQLQFTEEELVYPGSRRRQWMKKLIFGRGQRVLVFDPGEVPLGVAHLKSELAFLGIVLAVRLRRGIVFRPPRAVGEFNRLVGGIYRLSARLSQITLWRERPSLQLMRVGTLVPDTAFAEPSSSDDEITRDAVLVSMRGKRAFPSQPWIDGIRAFAIESGLRVIVASQVDEDEVRSREIADACGTDLATYEFWGDNSDLVQELRVRELYKRCALVISDRLHVLILAAQAGAIPVELATSPKPKVRTHFDTVGFDNMSLDVADKDENEIFEFLRHQATRSDEIAGKLTIAREKLLFEVDRFRTLVSTGNS